VALSAVFKVAPFKTVWRPQGKAVDITANGSARLTLRMSATLHRALRAYLRHHARFAVTLAVTVVPLDGIHAPRVELVRVSIRARS
jgi:hypothetical protein